MPHVTTVLASTANYMICDDHEFTDDLGKRERRRQKWDQNNQQRGKKTSFNVAVQM